MKVEKSIDKLLPSMDRKDIIETALKNRGALIHTDDIDDAIAISNMNCTRTPRAFG